MPYFLDLTFHISSYMPYVLISLTVLLFVASWVMKGHRDPMETMANFGFWALNQVLRLTLVGGITISILAPFAQATPLKIPVTWWSAMLVVVLADLTYYCTHYLEHRFRLLWVFHMVHHSSKELNLSTSFRLPNPWFGESLGAVFCIPWILLGVNPALMLFGKIIVMNYQFWIHTEKIGKLGVLEKVFNTPSHHRVHHAINDIYLDKNLGGILIIWDKLFGTYQEEKQEVPARYGLTHAIRSYNPITINLYGPWQLAQDVILRLSGSFR